MGNSFVSIALFGWIPAVLLIFAWLPARRAVMVSFLAAWLFLPMAGIKLAEGIPVYDKMSATCVGVVLGALIFDLGRVVSFRPTWLDLPMLIWCLCPIASSLSNGLGMYDGLSAAFRQGVTWGLPYVIGRVYFSDLGAVKELAIGLFVGGLVYVPLCLFEIRMSPQLHGWVYGLSQNNFAQAMRFGGWRPRVFMQDGLMVGMWMCMTGLIGAWMWRSSGMTRIWRGMPTIWMVVAVLVTAVLCKSTGAIVLLAGGFATLWATVRLKIKAFAWCLIIIAPAYCVVRAGGLWDGTQLLSAATDSVGQDRSQSLEFRMQNENILSSRAMQRPVFGWGGWGRARVHDDSGKDISITDGLWIIALGDNGMVGLGSLTLAMLLPAGLILWSHPARLWGDPHLAAVVVLAVVVVLYWIDCVPNGMVNPIFMLVAGGLAGLAGRTVWRGEQSVGIVGRPLVANGSGRKLVGSQR